MQVYDNAKQGAIYNNEKKWRLAFVRLVEQERLRRDHDAQVFCYARWTFLAAVAAVIVGVVGIVEGVIVTRCARLSADKLRSAATPTASCAAGRRVRPGNDRPRHWLWICSVGDGRACGTHYHQCKRALRTPRPPSIGLIIPTEDGRKKGTFSGGREAANGAAQLHQGVIVRPPTVLLVRRCWASPGSAHPPHTPAFRAASLQRGNPKRFPCLGFFRIAPLQFRR
jgi:hypothetical protein